MNIKLKKKKKTDADIWEGTWSRDSLVGIVTGYGWDGAGFRRVQG